LALTLPRRSRVGRKMIWPDVMPDQFAVKREQVNAVLEFSRE
jgi:hypothetical protein